MGANAQTTVPSFTALQQLTADQMNQSARTGVPVFAGTAERDAAFGGTGEKVLAEGQLCYLESTNVVQYYDGSTWATVGPQTVTAPGLVRIGSTTLSSNVTEVTSAFSTTYKNYRVVIDNAVINNRGFCYFRIGNNVSTSIYYMASTSRTSNGVTANSGGNPGGYIHIGQWEDNSSNSRALGIQFDINNPFEALRTTISGVSGGGGLQAWTTMFGGLVENTTSYTSFSIGTENGTFSSGTATVYGYAAS